MESGSGRQPHYHPEPLLLPVRRRGEPAMLKLVTEAEERFGVMLMEWWDGDGAARVLARDDDELAALSGEFLKSRTPSARPLGRQITQRGTSLWETSHAGEF
jgi:streptomycin 6-kinase